MGDKQHSRADALKDAVWRLNRDLERGSVGAGTSLVYMADLRMLLEAVEQHEAAPADDARECLMDVVSHHEDIVAGFEALRAAVTETDGIDTAAYWDQQIKAADRMKERAERALAAMSQPEPAVAACSLCGDSGYYVVEGPTTEADGHHPNLEPCDCKAEQAALADDSNSVTLDRRDLFDFARGAIKSALEDYKAGECMTACWYWQEATNRTEALLEALDTKSPYIGAQPEPAVADERAAFEWPPLPAMPMQYACSGWTPVYSEHQMQAYANAYGEAVRAQIVRASSPNAAGATVAWMHVDDPRDCVSDAKKRDMIEHAGAPGARLAANYSIALGRIAPAQAAERGTPVQIDHERKLTCEAIDSAIAFGYQNTNPPPNDAHWLATYWRMGQKLAQLEALPASARYPTAWVRFRSDGGFECPIMDSDARMCDTRRKCGAWSPLFLGPVQAGEPVGWDFRMISDGSLGDWHRCASKAHADELRNPD